MPRLRKMKSDKVGEKHLHTKTLANLSIDLNQPLDRLAVEVDQVKCVPPVVVV